MEENERMKLGRGKLETVKITLYPPLLKSLPFPIAATYTIPPPFQNPLTLLVEMSEIYKWTTLK